MYKELEKKVKEINKNDPFLVTITVFSKKEEGKLDTYVYTNNFPYDELEGTKKMVNKLIDDHKNTKYKTK